MLIFLINDIIIIVIYMVKDLRVLKNIKIAHRGLCKAGLIENSMSAFSECVKRNIPIELDIHILKDNTLVVIHDDDTERVTGKKVVLKDSNYDDIKGLKLIGTDEGIPLLKDVLELVSGKVLLDIELKYDVRDLRICNEVCKLLDVYSGKFIVKSFNFLYILWFRLHKKNYIRGVLISHWKKRYVFFILLSKPDFICYNYKKILNSKVSKYYRKEIPLLIYTVKDMVDIEVDYTGIIYEC